MFKKKKNGKINKINVINTLGFLMYFHLGCVDHHHLLVVGLHKFRHEYIAVPNIPIYSYYVENLLR